MMKVALSVAYFLIAGHMLDAARHYSSEDESFSFAFNLVFGLCAAIIGLELLLTNNV